MADAIERAFVGSPVALGGRGALVTPFQFVFTGEDHLRLAAVNVVANNTLRFTGRFLEEGEETPVPWSYDFTPTSNGEVAATVAPMGTGALINLAVRSANAIVFAGECFVRVDVVRGLTVSSPTLGTLLSGYIGSSVFRGWPGSALEQPLEGPGRVRLRQGSAPAAGAEPTIGLPVQTRWRIRSCNASLQTSAVAGSRFVFAELVQNSVRVFLSPSNIIQAAGQNLTHTFGAGADAPIVAGAISGVGSLPSLCDLETGAAADALVRFVTVGIDAGDQWTLISALVEEWRNPVTVEP